MPREYRKAVRARGVEETRGRVLDAARESLRQQRRIGMREIAGAAGVTVQTLYSHFGSKAGLLSALVEEAAGMQRDAFREWTVREKSADVAS